MVENFGAVKEAYLEIIDENKDLVKQLECKISTMDNNIVKLPRKSVFIQMQSQETGKRKLCVDGKAVKEKQRVKKQHA